MARTCQGPRLGQAREPGAAANFLSHLNYFFCTFELYFCPCELLFGGFELFFCL